MLSPKLVLCVALASGIASAQNMSCNLQNYKPASGIKAEQSGNLLTVSWPGESNQQLRAQFTIRDGQPVVQELAARDGSGTWIVLGKDLSPEFQVTTGQRRISATQRSLLKKPGHRYARAGEYPEVEHLLGCAARHARPSRHAPTCRAS